MNGSPRARVKLDDVHFLTNVIHDRFCRRRRRNSLRPSGRWTGRRAASSRGGPGEIRGRLVDSASGRAVDRLGRGTPRRGFDVRERRAAEGRRLVSRRWAARPADTRCAFARSVSLRSSATTSSITAEKPIVDVGAIGLTIVATKLDARADRRRAGGDVLAPDRNELQRQEHDRPPAAARPSTCSATFRSSRSTARTTSACAATRTS